MSTMTSLWNFCRYSKASSATRATDSGSSPFTWKIGTCRPFATSVVEYDDRELEGPGVEVLLPHHDQVTQGSEEPVAPVHGCHRRFHVVASGFIRALFLHGAGHRHGFVEGK